MKYLILFLFFIHQCLAMCNGGASLCNKRYNEVSYLVTHDSYAISPNLAATQDDSIVDQLNNGVRGIKLSAVLETDKVHLCHTFCAILDAGTVTDTLDTVAQWLEENPQEVVTIMWNNLYSLDADQIASAYEASRIMPFVYTHTNATWPTLSDMIACNRRVVNFIDAEADAGRAPWLMDQFSHVFETPYENTDVERFGCSVDRIRADERADDLMYVMNHFLYGVIDIASFKIEMPYKEKANVTNSEGSLMSHVRACTAVFKKVPTFLEVDFYLIGDAIQVVAGLNNVEPPSNVKTANVQPVSLQRIKKKLSPTDHVVIENKASSLCFNRSLVFLLSFILFMYTL